MAWIVARIKWLMLVSGALTCTMLYAAVAPQAALRSNFGEAIDGPVAEIVVVIWIVLFTGYFVALRSVQPSASPV